MRDSTQGIHPGFEIQGRCHQKSKIGVSVGPWKGLVFSKFFLKSSKIVDIVDGNHVSIKKQPSQNNTICPLRRQLSIPEGQKPIQLGQM